MYPSDFFEILAKVVEKKMLQESIPIAASRIESYLGVTPNKWRKWRDGQQPTAIDMARVCWRLGLSPRWALLGDGGHRAIGVAWPDEFKMADWPVQYHTIYNEWREKQIKRHKRFSETAFGKDLGLSPGKAQHWRNGHWPHPQDLAMLCQRFKLEPLWLLFNIGPMKVGARAAKSWEGIPVYVQIDPCGDGWFQTALLEQARLPFIDGVSDDAFALKVGACIESEGIRSGMLVVIDPQVSPREGDVVWVKETKGKSRLKSWEGECLAQFLEPVELAPVVWVNRRPAR
ncbi:LexA family protein [Desulfoluna butyratoxydans]|uniref:Lambda repressor-like dna-binding domain n=1 Tax=Desulfoluna butyratoxydans TaxID=231438 RepID=A0A4U8YKH3_9BACT|nr:hypothetical protein [Desulfoluna butyratoxydans]VFQ44365.1 hypothetical protein MSL71_20140 [Desulfoluna butyratoxydans]